MVDGLRVTLAGRSSAATSQPSQLAVAFDNGDAAALDCLELLWQPSGPLSLFCTEVRGIGHLCMSCRLVCPQVRDTCRIDISCIHRTLCEHTMVYFAHCCASSEQRYSCATSGQCCTEQARQQVGEPALPSSEIFAQQDGDDIRRCHSVAGQMDPAVAQRLLALQMFRARAADQISRRQSSVMTTLMSSCWTDLAAGLRVCLIVCPQRSPAQHIHVQTGAMMPHRTLETLKTSQQRTHPIWSRHSTPCSASRQLSACYRPRCGSPTRDACSRSTGVCTEG